MGEEASQAGPGRACPHDEELGRYGRERIVFLVVTHGSEVVARFPSEGDENVALGAFWLQDCSVECEGRWLLSAT